MWEKRCSFFRLVLHFWCTSVELNRTIFNFFKEESSWPLVKRVVNYRKVDTVKRLSQVPVSILKNKTCTDRPSHPLPMNVFFFWNSNIGTWNNRVTVWSGMGGKLDFSITPAEQRNVFSRLSFFRKDQQKKIAELRPQKHEDLSKTIMTGGMSTAADNSMLTWDNSVFLGGDRQRKCLSVDL